MGNDLRPFQLCILTAFPTFQLQQWPTYGAKYVRLVLSWVFVLFEEIYRGNLCILLSTLWNWDYMTFIILTTSTKSAERKFILEPVFDRYTSYMIAPPLLRINSRYSHAPRRYFLAIFQLNCCLIIVMFCYLSIITLRNCQVSYWKQFKMSFPPPQWFNCSKSFLAHDNCALPAVTAVVYWGKSYWECRHNLIRSPT